MPAYTETGGIRYGSSFYSAINFTWPFAKLIADPDGISIKVSLGKLWGKTFALERAQIKSIKKKCGFMGTGISIEHSNVQHPPLILFWTFRYELLKKELEAIGYRVLESDA